MTQPIHPMLERVARAMSKTALQQGILLNEWVSVMTARAAIQALLEPDEGMVEAGEDEATRVSFAMMDREASMLPENYPDYDGSDLAKLTYTATLKPLLGDEG